MNEDLLDVLDDLGEPHILVLGDLMLDRFIHGRVERLSPEAPAMILEHQGEEVQPGGAARVAMLLQSLGARVSLAGIVGTDDQGHLLRGLLTEVGIDCQAVLAVADRPTTSKQRFLALTGSGQPAQLLRLDQESRLPLPGPIASRMLEQFRQRLPECDAVLVADHDKGVCLPGLLAELLSMAASKGVPTLVDPARHAELSRYQGADALLPNRGEAAALLGRDLPEVKDGAAAAVQLLEAARAEAVLLKMDSSGLVLAQPQQRVAHYPAMAREVFDVTGAGDVVLAVAGLCRAARLDWKASAGLASMAARRCMSAWRSARSTGKPVPDWRRWRRPSPWSGPAPCWSAAAICVCG